MTSTVKLPELTDEDRQHLHYNPNTDDLVQWVRAYATSAVLEDRRAREVDAMTALQQIHDLLINLQPHIPQACYPGRAAFIDNYVSPALEIAAAAIRASASLRDRHE